MSKKHLITSGRWHANKVNKLKTLESKIVFEYLLSNPLTSRSGIYTIYSGGISEGIGRHLISAEMVREVVLRYLETEGLIKYCHDQDIVYILDFHRFIPFGSGKPAIIGKELLDEFEDSNCDSNQIVAEFWRDYVEKNRSKLNKLQEKLGKGGKGNPDNINLLPLLKKFENY